ncbi:MAG: hypothetical protein K2F81_02200 [Ruminococcus sp.]|nr:hypothetical protein [Ruminococcus sp.]
MYKYQINRLLKKHFPLLTIIIILSAASKLFAINISKNNDDLSKESQLLLDSYVQETIDYSADQRFSYISEKAKSDADKFSAIKSPSQDQIDDYAIKSNAQNAYRNSLVYNTYTLIGVQKYAKTGKGLVDTGIPENFIKTKNAYLNINEPKVVNEYHFKKFISLQSYSLIPVFVLLLTGLFIADSYEKKIDLQAKISKNSKRFFRSQEIILSIFILLLLFANTVCDMTISGLLTHTYELSTPIQSISDYVFLPKNLTISQAVLMLLGVETIGAFICYHAFVIAAQIMRSAKSYMIFGFSVIVLSTLITNFFPNSAIYIPTGITDKRSVLSAIKYMPKLKTNNIPIAVIIGLLLLCILCIFRYYKYQEKRNHLSFKTQIK